MYSNKKINKNNLLYPSLFLIFIVIGLNSFQDFGISIDENFHLSNGLHYYSFFKGLFFDGSEFLTLKELKRSFNEHHFKDPALFDFFVAFLIDIFNIQEIEKIYFLRHFLIFLIFLIGIFYFYLILKNRFSNNYIIIFGLALLFLSPRIFANSFYNNKDLIFLSVSCIFFYYGIKFLDKPSTGNAIIFGIFSALAFDTRIMAIVYIFAFYVTFFLSCLDDKKIQVSKIKNLLIIVTTTILFIYFLWPYLWVDPINNVIDFFSVIRDETPSIQILYFGDYFFSKSTPWHYNIIWILFTSPLTIIILFILGFLTISIKIFNNLMNVEKKTHKFWHNKSELVDIFLFLSFTLSFFMKVKFGVDYCGWRHIYFLYPLIIIIGLTSFESLKKTKKNKLISKSLFTIIFLELVFLSVWNYKNHPFQFVYFNPIFKSFTKNNFDLDYWGISNRSILEKIYSADKNIKTKITTISFTNLNDSLRILKPEIREKISIVHDLKDADYVIDNHIKKWNSTPGEETLKNNFSIFYELIVDGNVINTVYKRN